MQSIYDWNALWAYYHETKETKTLNNMQDLAFIMILLENSPRQSGLLALHWPFEHVTVRAPSNA